jgi:hypothetical protein
VKQARDAGLKIYMKSNLGITLDSRILELPFEAPIKANPTKAPEVFHYLRKRIVRAAADARTTPSTSRCSGSTIRSRC